MEVAATLTNINDYQQQPLALPTFSPSVTEAGLTDVFKGQGNCHSPSTYVLPLYTLLATPFRLEFFPFLQIAKVRNRALKSLSKGHRLAKLRSVSLSVQQQTHYFPPFSIPFLFPFPKCSQGDRFRFPDTKGISN